MPGTAERPAPRFFSPCLPQLAKFSASRYGSTVERLNKLILAGLARVATPNVAHKRIDSRNRRQSANDLNGVACRLTQACDRKIIGTVAGFSNLIAAVSRANGSGGFRFGRRVGAVR